MAFRLRLYPELIDGVAYVDVLADEDEPDPDEIIDKGVPLDRAREIYSDCLTS